MSGQAGTGEPRAALKAALEDFLAEARRHRGLHPVPDELVAYRAGELPAGEQRRVEDHLVACSDCLALLLDLERLADPESGGEASLTAAERAAAWQSLRARLGVEAPWPAAPWPAADGRPAASGFPPPRARALRFASPRTAYALAASLAVAALALSIWNFDLRRTVAALSRPQPNAPVIDLLPASGVRGGAEEIPRVEVAAPDRLLTLVLSPTGAPDYAGYAAEIVASGGRTVWRDERLEENPHGSFTLIVAGRFLPPGDIRIRLFGGEGGRWEPVGEFPLQVVYR
jgi:hypothetical protein